MNHVIYLDITGILMRSKVEITLFYVQQEPMGHVCHQIITADH